MVKGVATVGRGGGVGCGVATLGAGWRQSVVQRPPSVARSLPSGFRPSLSHIPWASGRRSLTSLGFGAVARLCLLGLVGGSTAVVGWCGVGGCCGVGLCDGLHLGSFGVCWGGFGVVFLVFAGFLGGVGVDLVWGWGACKVIRVAAADAERWRPTPFKLPVSVVLLCAAGWCGRPGVWFALCGWFG
ncbi:hypothetical protein ABIE37_004399 [Arthrobacter bambusae]|uniref:Uncharacterized protein n=1 Tax=Arthrobacter bambusae TaxID=1338426 RepID=A0ABV2PCV3_9MICC